MKDERLQILRMLSEGKLDAAQAEKLLGLLDVEKNPAPRRARWFRVRVSEVEKGRVSTNVRLPIEVMDAVLRLKAHLEPGKDQEETQKLIELLQTGSSGQTIEYDDPHSGHVEISIE
jgi:hypothetical protein